MQPVDVSVNQTLTAQLDAWAQRAKVKLIEVNQPLSEEFQWDRSAYRLLEQKRGYTTPLMPRHWIMPL